MRTFSQFQNEIVRRGRLIARSMRARWSPRDPVTVFHHIPKCGGTSFRGILARHFLVVEDYRIGWEEQFPPNVDLARLRSGHLLAGHFELEGRYLHQRYPEIVESSRFRHFTVVREPLALRASLYRFEKKHGVCRARSIEENLFQERNWLAARFPLEESSLSETLDRYDFIGTLDDPQLTLDVLAWKLGIPPSVLPHTNATTRDRPSSAKGLPPELVARFRRENALDYQIYEEAQRRLEVVCRDWRSATGA